MPTANKNNFESELVIKTEEEIVSRLEKKNEILKYDIELLLKSKEKWKRKAKKNEQIIREAQELQKEFEKNYRDGNIW